MKRARARRRLTKAQHWLPARHVCGSLYGLCPHGSGNLLPGPGWRDQAASPFLEESFYILNGSAIVQIGDQSYEVGPGNYGLIATGKPHTWRNAGEKPLRWLEMQAPQPRALEHGHDTFFERASGSPRVRQSASTRRSKGYSAILTNPLCRAPAAPRRWKGSIPHGRGHQDVR